MPWAAGTAVAAPWTAGGARVPVSATFAASEALASGDRHQELPPGCRCSAGGRGQVAWHQAASPLRRARQPRTDPGKRKSTVSILKKIRHKIQTAKGKAKKDAGRITGNRRLKAEGRTDQAAGEVKQAADKVKDAFKH